MILATAIGCAINNKGFSRINSGASASQFEMTTATAAARSV